MMTYLLRLMICLLTFASVALNSTHLSASSLKEEIPSAELSSIAESDEPVTATLLFEHQTLKPGQSSWVAIRMSIQDNWHAYWKNPGDAGMAPVVNWNLPEGFQVGELLFPTPSAFQLSTAVGYGYEKEAIFLAEITVPQSYDSSKPAQITADMRWVVCSDAACLPGDATLTLTLPVSQEEASINSETAALFTKARAAIPKKHQAIEAKRKEGAIEVAFRSPSDQSSAFDSVKFFPEQKSGIDAKAEIALKSSKETPGHHVLTLKDDPAAKEKTSALKGVLVFNASGKTESYDVDILIDADESDNEIISMADQEFTKGAQTVNDSGSVDSADDFEFKGGIALALVFAFLGGMILNLMPCVLPVISLKVLSFVKLAGESRSLIFRHGVSFSMGVMISFWVLASVLLALQAYGRAVGWGFQLQEPIFVAALASGLLIFALSLFGLFEIGTSFVSIGGSSAHKNKGLFGSFLSGILATAVATPCTGPFLGSAVGFAVTLPAPLAMLIFTSLGLGMSFPYLLLAAFPSLLRYLPKAGNWMVTFKEVMGFIMLATVLWLVWIFGAQTNSLAISLLLGGFFFFALACWVYGRWATPMKSKMTRRISMTAAFALLACGSWAVVTSSSQWVEAVGGGGASVSAYTNDGWEEFSVERVAELRKQGIPVFVDFTAKWCLICQANHLVLTKDNVSQEFNKKGVVKMKADWTKQDSTIAEELKKFGRNSVPLYVLYGTEEEAKPQILPQLLTPDLVVQSLNEL